MDGYYGAVHQLPGPLAAALCRVSPDDGKAVTEIRLRARRPIQLTTPCGGRFVCNDGRLAVCAGPNCLRTGREELAAVFSAVCGYSVHTAQRSVDQGFVAMPGGHRAGVCGTAFWRPDGTMGVGEITSINIRIARRVQLRLPEILCRLLEMPQPGVLIAGEPGSGKTTVLRSAAGYLAQRGKRVAVVDERCELAPDDGTRPEDWDVLAGYPKAVGMQHALRGLAPDVIVCDEIGAGEDVRAVLAAANGGTGLLASIHAAEPASLLRRPQYRQLAATGAFTHVVFLAGRDQPGTIREVRACADFM